MQETEIKEKLIVFICFFSLQKNATVLIIALFCKQVTTNGIVYFIQIVIFLEN